MNLIVDCSQKVTVDTAHSQSAFEIFLSNVNLLSSGLFNFI